MLTESPEAINDTLGVIVLKPRCFSTSEKTPIQTDLENRLMHSRLEILATACVCLSPQDVHDLYPDIFDNLLETNDRLEELRRALISYMADHVYAYLIFGDNALEHLVRIKQEIRDSIGYIKGSLDVQNAVHVPDQSRLHSDVSLFFPTFGISFVTNEELQTRNHE